MKKREVVLIVILVILLCGAGYYFFYYIPFSERIAELESDISQKTEEIDLAAQQVLLWGALSNTREKVADDWAGLVKTLPDEFDDADILTRIQKIITPHTTDVTIKFPESPALLETTAIYTVEISFTVPYDTLEDILKAFSRENIANRIIELNYTRVESNMENDIENESDEKLLMVYMSVDYLTKVHPIT